MILMSHPTGNANARQAALALAEDGLLNEFWTCVSWDPDSRVNQFLPAGLRQRLGRRALPEQLRPLTHHRPWREAGRMFAACLGWGYPLRHEVGWCSIDAVYQGLDRKVAREVSRTRGKGLRGVYAYEDGAAATFRAARSLGLKCFYDLPIGYWRAGHAIFDEEALREPEWAMTLTGRNDSSAKLARKDEELRLADTVLVASSFTRETLKAAPDFSAGVEVICYGSPIEVTAPQRLPAPGKLKVLFVGSLGQRKGLSYLIEAMQRLGPQVELTLIGQKTADECAPLNAAVRRHRWIPSLPHDGVLQEMSRHDVLVFPSLFEGFGLVILEAMAQGLPVITTSHTAGPDLISDGVDGFLAPIRDATALAEKLGLLAGDPARLAAMQEAARITAQKFTWENYRHRLMKSIRDSLATAHSPVTAGGGS